MALVPERKKSKHTPVENSSRPKGSASFGHSRDSAFGHSRDAGTDGETLGRHSIISKQSLISEGEHRALGLHPTSMGQVATASPFSLSSSPSGAPNYVAGVSTVASALSSAPREDGYYRSLASAVSVSLAERSEDYGDAERGVLQRMKRTRFYRSARVGVRRKLRQRLTP